MPLGATLVGGADVTGDESRMYVCIFVTAVTAHVLSAQGTRINGMYPYATWDRLMFLVDF